MEKWPTIRIDSLNKDLDIFDRLKKPEPGSPGYLYSYQYEPGCIKQHLCPPLPVSGNYLVHGFPLLDKAKQAGIRSLYVVELPVMTKNDLLTLCLKCEARPGKYTWQEMERMLSFIEQAYEQEQEEALMEQLDGLTKEEAFPEPGNDSKKEDLPGKLLTNDLIMLIQGHPDMLFLKRIYEYRKFPPFLKKLINKEILDFKTAGEIKDLPEEVFAHVLHLKYNKKLTVSEVKLFLKTINEIGQRNHLKNAGMITMCENLITEKDPVKAAKKIRMPELTGLYDRLNDIKNKVIKASGIHLEEPPFFEGDSFEIRFHFQSKKQLERRIKVLEDLKERTDELFKLL